jgi:hypothetical protein
MSRQASSPAPMCDAMNCSGRATRLRISSGSGIERPSRMNGSHQRVTWRQPMYQTVRPTAASSIEPRIVNSSAARSAT